MSLSKKQVVSTLIIALIIVIAALILVAVTWNPASQALSRPVDGKKAIIDMAGRSIEVPGKINKVLTTQPPTTVLIYALSPDTLLGVNFEPNAQDGTVYMPDRYRTLPNVGGWFGKTTGNYETFIAMKPDIIINGDTGVGNYSQVLSERQEKFGAIPVVGVLDARDATHYDSAITFCGSLLGADTQAASLSEFYHRVLSDVTSRVGTIPEEKRVNVYYAEGAKGLQTDPKGSPHSELIELCGGINVADCQITPGMGMTPVSMEQVLSWNPDVIIVGDHGFYQTIYSDPLWQSVPAVKAGRVYPVPLSPYPWFDRPPGVNRIIGIPWTAGVLYPELFEDMDLKGLTLEFYSKFYHYDLTDDEVTRLLNPGSGITVGNNP